MKPQNMYNVDHDLKVASKYNRQHGGVSEALRRKMKRPEDPNWRLNALNSPAYSSAFEAMLERRKKLNKKKK